MLFHYLKTCNLYANAQCKISVIEFRPLSHSVECEEVYGSVVKPTVTASLEAKWTCINSLNVTSIEQKYTALYTCTSKSTYNSIFYFYIIFDSTEVLSTANTTSFSSGNQAYFQVGKVTSGPCVGAFIIQAVIFKESNADCNCGLEQSNSLYNTIILSGGGCGDWVLCNGNERIDYNPGSPLE